MLVLSRKAGEQIRIGDTVEVTVLQIRGNRVQIGISAPAEVPIQRKELDCKIMLEQRLARTGRDVMAAATKRAAG